MTNVITYVTDEFLENFKVNFKTDYLPLYKTNNTVEITKLFSNPGNVHESSTVFDYVPLKLEIVDGEAAKENIRTLWSSLKHISISEAESEKMWVALANTYYVDYHLNQLNLISSQDKDRSIESRTIFNQGHKRSLMINNLSLLWWIAYYTVDVEHPSNPFHLTDFFVEGAFRGNAVAWFSSNIISNKAISLGILEAIKELAEQDKMIVNRYSYSNANKILNQIGGVRILDMLTREEVKEIICTNLLDTEKIRVPQMQ
ncbi:MULTISPECIES: DUF6339 family protein [Bacillus cereus group]|uniref:DUF6339 family protein n=1 Tax=Bacillus cereus group TaxID=86661 RepID=UPI002235A4E8|nr:DUF6339 family protein [Bacillus pacificus]HDR4367324.1 hypothetical protein [Bacillus cereus]HDR4709368.1 hypothetical protein [Bacillus paranthracis]HDR7281378.1 hypothetical protein [Bacillus paranthracis]